MSSRHPPRRALRRGGALSWALLTLIFPAVGVVPQPGTPVRPPSAQAGHEESEGLKLVAQDGDASPTPNVGGRCPAGAPERAFVLHAIRIDVTINRYLDHDPDGRMYVLAQDLARARAEERRNAAARDGRGEPAVTLGLQGDAIQPLVLRALPGECVRVELHNGLPDEHASFHLHGASLIVPATDRPAIASEPSSIAAPGARVSYEWWIPPSEPEGTHYFHSHGDDRIQTSHGLFGALIVEPPGSEWLDPRTRAPLASGWEAMIVDPAGSDFREHVVIYHEIGHENYQLLARDGSFVPLVDPTTSAYRPGARALNYRSEPFMNRLLLQQRRTGRFDESLAYSSYAFGDPATPVLRAYVGDPSKQRVVHGGSEVFHVHHVHGGSIRWRRQPGAEPSRFDVGLDKHPPLVPEASERTDSQSIGPSEVFDVANECGAGGCQASVGDFLLHCHVAQHYFAGMWGIWRVYNTLQGGRASTDTLAPLAALPDREAPPPAVSSERLRIDPPPGSSRADDLSAVVEPQLPPRGRARGYDASVLDWVLRGTRYVGEPETRARWPGYRPARPGTRRPLLFDPRTGRLAYPFLRPHLGRRPPFAPGHGPSPFLDPYATDGRAPPRPGANGEASTCPGGALARAFAIHAITLPITLNARLRRVDPLGQLYVLKEEEAAVRARNGLRVPLAIRANAGQDCVDVVLKNEIPDGAANHGLSKVNLHIHFAQFDVQGSDGVITGFNYEQSVRPFRASGRRLTRPAAAGSLLLAVRDPSAFARGALVGVGMDEERTFEVARVRARTSDALVLDTPLRSAHGAGEWVSTEFVRYRWYPDAQVGTSYFHDHVNALVSWRHGLYGALVVEPPGSTYHHPDTGRPLRSGPIADVHTSSPVSLDVRGSFRELVLFVHDDLPITHEGRSTGSAFNLRVEPFDGREPDPYARGDPETPILRAHLGDPIVLRTLVAATNEVHTVHVEGHPFRLEPWSRTSPPVSALHVGISERFDVSLGSAGGTRSLPGDYVYSNGRSFKAREGSWGLIRVLSPGARGPRPLPGVEPGEPQAVCPDGAPRRRVAAEVVRAPLAMLDGDEGTLLVAAGSRGAAGPLVVRAQPGECIEIEVRSTVAPLRLRADPLVSDPAAARVEPGSSGAFPFYADATLGETVALLRDTASPVLAGEGLYGAIAVVPADAAPARDLFVFVQDEDAGIGTHNMPYQTRVEETVGINLAASPLGRATLRAAAGDGPGTVLEAYAGEPVRLHVLAPWSEQNQVFTIEGHRWAAEPGRAGSDLLDALHHGGLEAAILRLTAGGEAGLAGDYLIGNHREPYREAGQWGLLRVHAPCARAGIDRLPGAPRCGPGGPLTFALTLAVVGACTLGVAYARRRRARAFSG